jgi:hypothetical protein
MKRTWLIALAYMAAGLGSPVGAQSLVSAAPVIVSDTIDGTSVSIYRNPDRGQSEAMNLRFLQGFALISEKRTITLPQGPATIRFDGVAEGMIAVSAIVTDLPGGTVQKNRDKAILSPASLVDGTLGNRVTLRRNNPATGQVTEIDAIVRSVANQGLVLETAQGFETLRCSGLPETLVFGQVPANLSAKPVLTVETVSPQAATVQVTLTYLASGFDWSANYVAEMDGNGKTLDLMAWLTLANSNGQSFQDADLVVIAGKLNVAQPFYRLADKPDASPLRLRCFPLGSSARGSDIPPPPIVRPPPAPAPMAMMRGEEIMVTAARQRTGSVRDSAAPIVAEQEELGDLKLYRVPFRSTVAANGQKQVAFAVNDGVKVTKVYRADAGAYASSEAQPMQIELRMVNKEKEGLGLPLPLGGIAVFEQASGAQLLIGESNIPDYPVGADIEFIVAASNQVLISTDQREKAGKDGWRPRFARVSNANPFAVEIEIALGQVSDWTLRRTSSRITTKEGKYIWSAKIPANDNAELRFDIREAGYEI